jgi:hypothetical protein
LGEKAAPVHVVDPPDKVFKVLDDTISIPPTGGNLEMVKIV